MKILIFENDFDAVQGSFELLNIIHFGGNLDYKIVPKYQDAGNIQQILAYDFIFIDIDLASGSYEDGFGIIRMLITNNYPLTKMSILTGHRDMPSRLRSQGIKEAVKITYKALTYKVLYTAIMQP